MPPKPHRFIDEALLDAELQQLHECLGWIYTVAKASPAEAFADVESRLGAGFRIEFEAALMRAGVETASARTRRDRSVYISAGFRPDLLRQVLPALRFADLAPVMPRQAAREQLNASEWQAVKAQMSHCAAGVISFVDPGGSPASERRAPSEDQVAELTRELDYAELMFPQRLIIVAQSSALKIAPHLLRGKIVISLDDEIMHIEDRARFMDLIQKDNWI